MPVLTVFCHGTGFNRVKGSASDELVAFLHNGVVGDEARIDNGIPIQGNHIINEGPGCAAGGLALPSEVNPMTGRLKSDEDFKYGKGHGKRSGMANAFGGQRGGDHSAGRGNLDGHGWDDNVQRTVHIIQTLKFENMYDVDVVNMVGWSRGAVTCIRIANKLWELFGNSIRCNIFAVDPVAGLNAGVEMEDTRVIPASVDNYVALLAMHEMRRSFKVQDRGRMRFAGATNNCFLPMPGKHNEQVMGRSGVAHEPQSRIALSLAYGFLRSMGTQFGGPPPGAISSSQNMCKIYGQIRLALQGGQYSSSSGAMTRVVGTGLRRRSFAKKANMSQYVSGGKASYWVNEHHRACFKSSMRGLYDAIFRSSIKSGQTEPMSGQMLASMGGANGRIARSLEAMDFITRERGQVTLDWASGRYAGRPNANLWPANLPKHA